MTELNWAKLTDTQGNRTQGKNYQVQYELSNGDPSLESFEITTAYYSTVLQIIWHSVADEKWW